jgi:transcriptional regulator with XRE-family HTH domain
MAKNPNPIDKHVGARIRMRRLMLEMSQEKLADKLGLTFQQVQKYEKGTNRVSASRLLHVSQILGVEIPFFFEGVPQAFATSRREKLGADMDPAQYSNFLATTEGLSLARAFQRIGTSTLRRSIVHLVEQLAGEDRR